MYAKKANKVYQVESLAEMQKYISQGFDIFGDNGEIVKHNPSKTIAYTEYERLLKENNDLRAELADLHLELAGTENAPPIGGAPEDSASLETKSPASTEEDPPKTLAPTAENEAPKMGGKGAKVKASVIKPDGDGQ